MRTAPFAPAWLACVALTLLLAACGTIPDLTPFADATSAVATGVHATHESLRGRLDELGLAREADAFSEQWAERLRAADALVEYADSLAAIASAGHSGRQDALALAGSLQGLLNVVEVWSPLSEVVVGVGVELATALAEVRAAAALEDALDAADPVVAAIADIIEKDLDRFAAVFPGLADAARGSAIRRHGERHGTDRARYNVMLTTRSKLADRIAVNVQRWAEKGRLPDGETSMEALLGRLAALDRILVVEQAKVAALDAELDEIGTAFGRQERAVRATRRGVAQWRRVHARLAATVREGRSHLNVRLLMDVALQIRDVLRESPDE